MEHLPGARHTTKHPNALSQPTLPATQCQDAKLAREVGRLSSRELEKTALCYNPPAHTAPTHSDLLRPAPPPGLALRQENTSDGSLLNYLGEGVIRLNKKPLPSFSLQARLKTR